MSEPQHKLVSQYKAELVATRTAKPEPVNMVECSCGWRGEAHVWAYHLQSEVRSEHPE